MNEIFTLFTNALSAENEISPETATKIVTWLTTEGVLDTEMLTETYGPVTGSYAENDNVTPLTSVA